MANTVFITGGSAGIGAACARLAAAEGRDVILTYNSDKAGAEAVAADVRAAGQMAQVIKCNVGDPAQIAAAFDEIDPAAQIDLINNAGIVGQTAKIADLTAARVAEIFNINVVGAIEVARLAVAHMRGCGTPAGIVNISSAAARLGSANQYVDYAASKGAIDTFTIGLADELAPEGIRVNAIRPGLIETELHAKGGEPGRADRLAHMVPMKRKGSAEEVAQGILWLLSDNASYVTRTIVDVAGGR